MKIFQLSSNCKYVIYGADAYGEIALTGLRFCGLDAAYFIDRKLAGQQMHGVNIKSPIKENLLPSYCYIVAAGGAYKEVCDYLHSNDCHKIINLLPFFEMPLPTDMFSAKAKEFWFNKHLYYGLIHQGSQDEIFIPHVDFCTAEFCTLKCRHCSQLIPYYPDPKIINLDYSIECFDRFLDAVDFLTEVRVLGGEPFCNPETYKIIEHLYCHPKIGQTVIYTNGTILPGERLLNDLNEGMAIVHISDYGVNQDRIETIVEAFSNYPGIKYFLRGYDSWMDLGDSSLKEFTDSQIKINYDTCNQRACKHFHGDKLYECPRVASLYYMGICGNEEEWVDFSIEKTSKETFRQSIKALFNREIPYEACQRCNGSRFAKPIPAAEQIHD